MFSKNTYPVNQLPARLFSIIEHYLGSWYLFILQLIQFYKDKCQERNVLRRSCYSSVQIKYLISSISGINIKTERNTKITT